MTSLSQASAGRMPALTGGGAGSAAFASYRGQGAAEGGALQLVFVVSNVADEGDLNDPPAAHHWGFGLLEADLPRLLNRQNGLNTGNGGTEQKGTPSNVGQHALELR